MPTAKVTPDDSARKFAHGLLKSPTGASQDNVRRNVVRLLDALGVDSFPSYRTTDGIADIYLPQRRTLIAVKPVGMAVPDGTAGRAETLREPLDRPIQAEIRRDLTQFAFEESTREWTGILTDGRSWRFWRYVHAQGATGRDLPPRLSPEDGADGLIRKLQHLLGGEMVGKPWVPESLMSVFAAPIGELGPVYESLSGNALRTARTQVSRWREKLRAAAMEPKSADARDRLFVAHSALATLARGIMHSLSAPGVRPEAGTVLNDGLASWAMATAAGRNWAQALLDQVHAYEWRRRPGNLLSPLYEQVVGASGGEAFSAFQTPDWLAQLMVEELLDEAWRDQAALDALNALQAGASLARRGVLDPACGSGTLLYHAARRILDAPALRDARSARQADVAASLVHGIDVHPAAVEIARASLLRALPAEPGDGARALRIHEGDALLGCERIAQSKVDRIVANPPWVKMTDFKAATRRREMEELAIALGLRTRGARAPRLDIAQLFLHRCRERYLNAPDRDPAGWLVKASALAELQGRKFREWQQGVLAQSIDLAALQPFGAGRAKRFCLLLELRVSSRGASAALTAKPVPGRRRPQPQESLEQAAPRLRFTETPESFPQAASGYVDERDGIAFRQGATIAPEVLLVTQARRRAGPATDAVRIQTVASRKASWRNVLPQLGEVPGHWIQPLIKSEDLLPFAVLLNRQSAVIPTDAHGALLPSPGDNCEFWAQCESIYAQVRGRGSSIPRTLAAQINHADKLAAQLPLAPGKSRTLVLHPAAGERMRGARTHPGSAIAGDSLCHFSARTEDEAAYLVALLNAPVLSPAFAQARESRQHLSAWRKIPIPRFDAADPCHLSLANACLKAERLVAQEIRNWSDPVIRQVSAAKRLHSLFESAGLNSKLNAAAAALLPNHAIA